MLSFIQTRHQNQNKFVFPTPNSIDFNPKQSTLTIPLSIPNESNIQLLQLLKLTSKLDLNSTHTALTKPVSINFSIQVTDSLLESRLFNSLTFLRWLFNCDCRQALKSIISIRLPVKHQIVTLCMIRFWHPI